MDTAFMVFATKCSSQEDSGWLSIRAAWLIKTVILIQTPTQSYNDYLTFVLNLWQVQSHLNYNKSTGIKVYSSDKNTSVYSSKQNHLINHILKVTWGFK